MNNRLGFTILEIIIAIVMIGIMLAVALPKYNRVVEKSRQAEALTNLAAIRAAQMRFYAEKGEWATDFADDGFDAEEPNDPNSYFTYSITGASADTVASAIRNTAKNCCFGAYTAFIASSGKIWKKPDEDASQTPP